VYPYPYVIDPGFYDWGDSGDAAYDQDYAPSAEYGVASPATPQEPDYAQPPYAQAPAMTGPQPVYPGATATVAPAEEEPLTLIFKNGRAPQKMQNYIMNAKALTDMDRLHYERIPLDQIDIAATEQVNRAHGVDFQVPGATRE
jgi:hypothetical protein